MVEHKSHMRLYEPTGEAPAGFEKVTPTLEDAYLVLMRAGALPGLNAPQAAATAEVRP